MLDQSTSPCPTKARVNVPSTLDLVCISSCISAMRRGLTSRHWYLVGMNSRLWPGGRERPLNSCDVRIQEMAQEFPKAEWIVSGSGTRTPFAFVLYTDNEGVDLVPVQNDDDMPDNVHYVKDDVTKGLAFPDASFDFVHGRFLLLGVSVTRCRRG